MSDLLLGGLAVIAIIVVVGLVISAVIEIVRRNPPERPTLISGLRCPNPGPHSPYHLNVLDKENGGLVCLKCGGRR